MAVRRRRLLLAGWLCLVVTGETKSVINSFDRVRTSDIDRVRGQQPAVNSKAAPTGTDSVIATQPEPKKDKAATRAGTAILSPDSSKKDKSSHQHGQKEKQLASESTEAAKLAMLNPPAVKVAHTHAHTHTHTHTKRGETGYDLPPPPAPGAPVESSDSSESSGGMLRMGAGIAVLLLIVGVVSNSCMGNVSKYWGSLSSYGTQIGSFAVLVCVQSCAILLFKLCQVGGVYSFSPASCVAMTEACKLALAVSLHSRHVQATGGSYFEGVSPRICAHYFFLAILYTVNNQLTFFSLEIVDPGTFTLAKSLAPYIVALMLRVLGQRLNELQWVCVLLQCICIAVSQYDACKARGLVPMHGYMLVAVATCITAVSSVWNQKVVKGFNVPVNLQNSLLYVFGLAIASFSYAVTPTRAGTEPKGFFEGYTPLALLLVLFQAFHGLAVTLVYKYADAIVKNFANSAVMAILVIISANFFDVPTTLHSWLGVAGVLVTTYAYMNIALKM